MLFPHLLPGKNGYSKNASRRFSQWLDKLGIIHRAKVFHSFRHLFKDMCRNTGFDTEIIDQICGHEPGTEGGKYGVGRRIDVLSELLAKVVPPVKLPRITPAKSTRPEQASTK